MLFISGNFDVCELEFAVGFNLAIEMLFISGACSNRKPNSFCRFNLAIEMLFISGTVKFCPPVAEVGFQSRNRDAFHFRLFR